MTHNARARLPGNYSSPPLRYPKNSTAHPRTNHGSLVTLQTELKCENQAGDLLRPMCESADAEMPKCRVPLPPKANNELELCSVVGVYRNADSCKMLNLHAIPTRVLLHPRTPLPSTAFRHQSRLRLKAQTLGCGRVECRYASTPGSADLITPPPSSQPPPKSWVERAPQKIRPYLYLARVDKPIGTLLLYYPCSTSPSPEIGILEL